MTKDAEKHANKVSWDKAGIRIDKVAALNNQWSVDRWTNYWKIEIQRQQKDYDKAFSEFMRNQHHGSSTRKTASYQSHRLAGFV